MEKKKRKVNRNGREIINVFIEIVVLLLLLATSILVMINGIDLDVSYAFRISHIETRIVAGGSSVSTSGSGYGYIDYLGAIFKFIGMFGTIICAILLVYKFVILVLYISNSVKNQDNIGNVVDSESLDDKIEKVKVLVEQGLVTQEEFEKYRQKAVEEYIKYNA